MDRLRNSSIVAKAGNGFAGVKDFLTSGSPLSKIALAVIFIVVFIASVSIFRKIYKRYKQVATSSPWILKGTKEGKKAIVITQNPETDGSITAHRSKNEFGGLEFSYMIWIYIADVTQGKGTDTNDRIPEEGQHILHKGNATAKNIQAPGIWLHKNKNSLRINMNTFKHVKEFVDVDNIPLNKWVHLTVAVRQRDLDVFINGNIVQRLKMKGLPRQNYGNIYLNAFRGIDGFMSNTRYFNFYISFREIDEHIKYGPSLKACIDTGEKPPYFVPNWWLS